MKLLSWGVTFVALQIFPIRSEMVVIFSNVFLHSSQRTSDQSIAILLSLTGSGECRWPMRSIVQLAFLIRKF